METQQLRQIDEHLQHLSYTEKSRAVREAKKWMQEEAMEEQSVLEALQKNGHSPEASKAIYQRARVEIINEKISKNRTAFIVMCVLSIAVCAILPLMAEDTMQTGWRRVVLYMAAAPVVTIALGIYLLVLRHERRYITWNGHE
jgi:hypothetical protein